MPPTIGTNVLGRKVLYLPSFFTYGESASQAGKPTQTKRQPGAGPAGPRAHAGECDPVSDGQGGRKGLKCAQQQRVARVGAGKQDSFGPAPPPVASRHWPLSSLPPQVVPENGSPGRFPFAFVAFWPCYQCFCFAATPAGGLFQQLPGFFPSSSFPCIPQAVGPPQASSHTRHRAASAQGVAVHLRPPLSGRWSLADCFAAPCAPGTRSRGIFFI